MMFWDRLKVERRKILGNFRNPFGQVPETLSREVREEIFLRLESCIVVEQDRKIFPYEKIAIRLLPSTKTVLQQFKSDFLVDFSLQSDICHTLGGLLDQSVSDLKISIELQEDVASMEKGRAATPLFEMELLDSTISEKPKIPELHLEIIKGNAEQPVYRINKDCLLVGCMPEVHDREGRLVRKNNVVFPHEGSEINTTVGNMHARIWFDHKRQEFCVMDESSRYGTRVIRGGLTIEVPSENPRGVGLHTGDEVCFGQACLRFVLVQDMDES